MIRPEDIIDKGRRKSQHPVKLTGKPFAIDPRRRPLHLIPAAELDAICRAAMLPPEPILAAAAACYGIADKRSRAVAYRIEHAPARLSRMREDLFERQRVALNKFVADEYGAILLKPGRGKTRLMLELIHLRAHPKVKVLWLCPRQVYHSIEREIETPRYREYSHIVCSGASSKKKFEKLSAASRNFYLLNYHALLSDEIVAQIEAMRFDVVVIDEGHAIANATNKWSKALHSISHTFSTRFELTGTAFARPTDCYSQISFLDHGDLCGLDYYRWAKEAVSINEYNRRQSFVGGWQAKIDAWLDRHAVMSMPEDFADMKEPVRHQIEVELSDAEAKVYSEMRKDYLTVLDNVELTAPQKVTQMNYLRQITGGGVYLTPGKWQPGEDGTPEWVEDDDAKKEPRIVGDSKIAALVEFAAAYADEPILVSHAYTMEAGRIADALRAAGRTVGVLNGATSDADEKSIGAAFGAGKLGAVVMQAQKGVGIDGLQAACKIHVHFSRVFGWRTADQLEGRLVRSGQNHAVLIVDLLAVVVDGDEEKSTIDAFMVESIAAAYETAEDIVRALRGKI